MAILCFFADQCKHLPIRFLTQFTRRLQRNYFPRTGIMENLACGLFTKEGLWLSWQRPWNIRVQHRGRTQAKSKSIKCAAVAIAVVAAACSSPFCPIFSPCIYTKPCQYPLLVAFLKLSVQFPPTFEGKYIYCIYIYLV